MADFADALEVIDGHLAEFEQYRDRGDDELVDEFGNLLGTLSDIRGKIEDRLQVTTKQMNFVSKTASKLARLKQDILNYEASNR